MKDIDDLDHEARRSKTRIEGRVFEIILLQEVIRGRGRGEGVVGLNTRQSCT